MRLLLIPINDANAFVDIRKGGHVNRQEMFAGGFN